MQMYELQPIISNIHKRNKEHWEQTRLLAYITAQVNSTKKLKPSDIITFSWDNTTTGNTTISNEDVQRLKNKAKQYINNG